MRETITKRILNIFGMSVLTVLLLACNDGGPGGLQVRKQEDKAIVSFSVVDARTALPQASLADAASYKLLGELDGAAEAELAEFTARGATVPLESGTWNFTLKAFNGTGGLILQDSVSRQINLAGTNRVSFSLSPVKTGTGKIEITLNVPESAGITRISASGDIDSENLTPNNSGNFVYTKDGIAAGDHFINFELYSGEAQRAVVSELVLVRSNLSSSKTITLAGDDLKPLLTGTVSIIGVESKYGNAPAGETLTVDISALNGAGIISYQWNNETTEIGTDSAYAVQDDDVGGTITVTVTRAGYIGEVTSAPLAAVPALIPVTFKTLTANGSYTQTTTALTLTFDQEIIGLSATDITLSGLASVWKGTLSGSGPVYTLQISDFRLGGTLNVSVAKSGYTIIGSPNMVTVYTLDPSNGTANELVVGVSGGYSSINAVTRVWYSFPVTNGSTYYVWWDDSSDGNGSSILTDIEVKAMYSNSTLIFDWKNSSWSSPTSFTANQTGTVYLEVRGISNTPGSYRIMYNTSNTRP
jgi:hypothetical protein